MANSEGFTVASVDGKPVIGCLTNNWRQKWVTVYAHPTNKTQVISVGRTFDGKHTDVCVEDRQAYERVISLYPETAIYD